MKGNKDKNTKISKVKLKSFLKTKLLIISIVILTLSLIGLVLLTYIPIKGNVYWAKIRGTYGVLEIEIKVKKSTMEITGKYNGIKDPYGDREIYNYYLWDNDLFIQYGQYGEAVHAGNLNNYELIYRFPKIVEYEYDAETDTYEYVGRFDGYLGTVELKCILTSSIKTTIIVLICVSGGFILMSTFLIIYDNKINKLKEDESEKELEQANVNNQDIKKKNLII